jgi:hypothetical protein
MIAATKPLAELTTRELTDLALANARELDGPWGDMSDAETIQTFRRLLRERREIRGVLAERMVNRDQR